MARKLLLCTVIVAVFAAGLAQTEAPKKEDPAGALKSAGTILSSIIKPIQDILEKALTYYKDAKQLFRQEEGKIMSEIPEPIAKVLKEIVKKIRKIEDAPATFAVNVTACVAKEAKPALDVLTSSIEKVKVCVADKTANMTATIAEFKGLAKKAIDTLNAAPKELASCVKTPPTSESFLCLSGKVQEYAAQVPTLFTSITTHLITFGKEFFVTGGGVIACWIQEHTNSAKTLGEILKKITSCEKEIFQNNSK